MRKNFKIILWFLLTLFVLGNQQCFSQTELTDKDKLALINYCHSIIKNYFKDKKGLPKIVLSKTLLDLSYDRVYVTLIYKGELRGCQSGLNDGVSVDVPIGADLREATIKAIKDTRFGGTLKEKEATRVDVMLSFLSNQQLLKSNDFDSLQKYINAGIDSVEMINGDKKACSQEFNFILNDYSHAKTLELLCKKIGLLEENVCYLKINEVLNKVFSDNPEVKIFKFNTFSFKKDKSGRAIDLYKYNTLVDESKITTKAIIKSISLAKNWFLNNVNRQSRILEYEYYPIENEYSEEVNHVRNLACLWGFTEIKNFLKNRSLDRLIRDTLSYYLKYKSDDNDHAFLMINNEPKLSYNAFMVCALLNLPKYPDAKRLSAQFANGILKAQNEDGSYNTDITHTQAKSINFYPGEAMLALMKIFISTRDAKYLDSVKKAFPYYRDYWRANKKPAFIPWHTQAYLLFYRETHDQKLADFVFEMNDWLVGNWQLLGNAACSDELGCFGESYSVAVAAYLEGVNDAYRLAVEVNDISRIQRYQRSLELGTRCILQHQFNAENTFYFKNPKKAIGGFRNSLISNSIRNDNAFHSVRALIKAYQNEIFSHSSE